MPNRMIRDWTDSLRMDGLSADAERLFIRLIMKADDYGRFHGDVRLIKAACFPLSEDIKKSQISAWLGHLKSKGLIVDYVAEERAVIAIVNYGQRLKMSKAKFPQRPGEKEDWLPIFNGFLPLPGTSGKFPPEEKPKGTETEPETKAEGGKKDRASLEEVKTFVLSLSLPESDAVATFYKWEGNGWSNAGKPIKDWRATIRAWKAQDFLPSQKLVKKDNGFTLDQVGLS